MKINTPVLFVSATLFMIVFLFLNLDFIDASDGVYANCATVDYKTVDSILPNGCGEPFSKFLLDVFMVIVFPALLAAYLLTLGRFRKGGETTIDKGY